VSNAGSDWVEIHVIDTETGKQLPDVVRWAKFSGAVWAADGQGFYYAAYDEPAAGSELSGVNEYQTVYYHRLGDAQSDDKLIYRDNDHALRYFHGQESSDGKYIFVTGTEGTSGSEVLFRPAAGDAPFKVLLPGFENDYTLIDCKDDKAYFLTNDGAPNYRVAVADLTEARPVLRDFIPENTSSLLQHADFAGGYLMASYLEDAHSAVMQFSGEGTFIRRVELPAMGSVGGFVCDEGDVETFYSLSTFTAPPTIYRYELASGTSTVLKEPQVNFDPSLYITEQIFFTSKDGTQVPMFVTRRKEITLDGQNPLMLYGYGGFNLSRTPDFNPTTIMFLEQGGIWVSVTLRGGGEYGEKWHRAGMLDSKQNVFDDFIGAAEHLIAKGYTSPAKLAINGGSNGGLLVGACMVQRPDLFAVAIPQVGVLDMLRYHRFTVGWGWVVEYGSADDAAQFDYIYKYSPLHNLLEGVCYPATLITTGDHDDRVVPAHSFKFAARLQAVQACDRPALIRIDTNAGHGAGKPTSKRIDEAADIYSFVLWNTDSKYESL
jgi:prolyl oligopeptidase